VTTRSVEEYVVSDPAGGPYAITTGPDGALWFTQYRGHRIGRITTAGEVTEFSLPTARRHRHHPLPPSRIWPGPESPCRSTAPTPWLPACHVAADGATIVSNAAWNGALAAKASITVGFVAAAPGTDGALSVTVGCTARPVGL
jgi:hypothetical protein